MVSINPRRIVLSRPVDKNKEANVPQKPTLQQMNDLYSNWCGFKIPYYPPQAATEMLKNRTECMEKYIKDNNLDIDVQNLELFFGNVKEKTGNMGGMSGEHAILKMLQDYIENGYNPNLVQERQTPTRPTTGNSVDNLEFKKGSNLEEILKIKEALNNDFQAQAGKAGIESAAQIINDRINNDFNFFS